MAKKLHHEPVLPNEEEAKCIRELDLLMSDRGQIAPELVGPDGKHLDCPASVIELLRQIVHALARGNAVSVVPIQAELTTQQAADLLNVSRPFLIKLLESGEIPFHSVGSHRRIPFRDLMEYRKQRDQRRREILKELTREAQEMGFYE